jgi:hypothetical protein
MIYRSNLRSVRRRRAHYSGKKDGAGFSAGESGGGGEHDSGCLHATPLLRTTVTAARHFHSPRASQCSIGSAVSSTAARASL